MLIEEALYRMLSENAAITDMVGSRIFPVEMPPFAKGTTPYPALIYTLDDRERSDTHDGPDGLVKSFYSVDCLSAKYTEAKTLADKFRLAVNGQAQAMAAIYAGHIKRVVVSKDRDTKVWDEVEEFSLFDIVLQLTIQHREALA